MTETVIEKEQQKNSYNAILALLIPFAAMAAVILIYGVRYDTNDDATIANLSAGAYGTGLHAVHINIILSALMRPLYMIAGDVNWYVIIQFILSGLGIAAIMFCLMKKIGTEKGVIIGIALLMPFASNFFYTFQYSKTSMLMLTGGLLLITENLDKINRLTLAGIILSLFGSMTRWESFFAVGGLYAAILMYRFFTFDKKGKINAVFTMLMLFVAVFGAEAADVMIYNSDPGWKEYVEYNAARTEYSDYKVYLLKGENIFREDGINDCEFALLNRWDFYDKDRFTTELLNDMCKKIPGKSLKQTVLDTAYTFKTLLYGQSWRYAFTIVIAAALVSFRKKRKYLPIAGTAAMFGMLLMFLLYRGRFTRWIESGLLWAFIVVVVFALIGVVPEKFDNKKILAVVLALMCAISVPEYTNLISESRYRHDRNVEKNHMFDDISKDKENLYLLSSEQIDYMAGYDVWRPREDDYFSNIVALGGWLSRTPYRDEVLAKYSIERPMVDCVDNPNVYLDESAISIIAEYAQQQLGVPVYPVKNGSYSAAPYQLVTQIE